MKSTDKKEKQDRKKQVNEVKPILISDVMPVVNFDQHGKYFVLEDGSLFDIYQINCKDLLSASDDEIEFDNDTFDKLYKIYADDLKILSFNFPTDTSSQQAYIKHIYDKTANPIFKEKLQEKYDEAIAISEQRSDREFYLFFYGKNEDDLREKQATIYLTLSRSFQPLVSRISAEKKQSIIYKMCNPCQNLQEVF